MFSVFAFAILPSGEIKIFAVTEDERGMAADLILYTIPGTGEVAFITSNSLVGKDTQSTGNIALLIAQGKSGVLAQSKNFIFDIKANASEVDGPSAGAAMTLLAYSLLSEKIVSPDVGITGTINSDGSVGVVGGVYPKAKVASEQGIKLFMIPRGEANQIIKENDKVESINLLNYGPEKLGMKIVEVTTIDDVINYAYTNINEINVDPGQELTSFVPEAIAYKQRLAPMKEISQEYLDKARNAIDEAKKELEITNLDESIRSAYYPQLGVAERNLELSQIYLDQNYLYSAANYAFNARVLAGTIATIAANPSLLNSESNILGIKVSSLRDELISIKKEFVFIPLDNYEWVIGAQQRIAYAENALNNLKLDRPISAEEDEQTVLFDRVYDFVSAESWLEVTADFLNEAKKSTVKKQVVFTDDIISQVDSKIKATETLLKDANVSQATLEESTRRLNAAKISFNNGFYFAALYDAYFAESFVLADLRKLSIDDLQPAVESLINDNKNIDSIWGSLFLDHSIFFLRNAVFEGSINRFSARDASLSTSYDLAFLAGKLEEANLRVEEYLAFTEMEDYVSNDPIIEVTYVKKDSLSPLLVGLLLLLIFLLLFLIFIGSRSSKKGFHGSINRAEKINSVLNRLDKALAHKKITQEEYFHLKKKYEDEFNLINIARSKRSKITLDLDESRAKQKALEKGLKDLKKHYKSGLILPEDYERHLSDVGSEIVEIKGHIKQFEEDLRETRKVSAKKISEMNSLKTITKQKKKKPSDFDVKGTEEIGIEEMELEKKEKENRRLLLKKFKKKHSKK